MRRKWWMILLAVLLIAVVVVCTFWDTIAVYIMPKTVLTGAITDAVSQLETRFSRSPVAVFAKSVTPDGRYAAQAELKTENDVLGDIRYDLTVDLDVPANQFLAKGTAVTQNNSLDLSLYMDRNFMALSSDDLVKGTYYGITYDTFSSDIGSIPLASMFLSKDILSDWEASVAAIQARMTHKYQLPEIPDISETDMQKLLTAILLLPVEVSEVEMSIQGEYQKCHRITYSADGEQVKEVLSYLMDTGNGSDASVTATFYLHENQLVWAHMSGAAGGNSILYALELLQDDALTLRIKHTENGVDSGFCVRHAAALNEAFLNETWTWYPDFEGRAEAHQLSYRWDAATGEMQISDPGSDTPVCLNLAQTQSGLRLETDRFDRLIDLLSRQEEVGSKHPIACEMTVSQGISIPTPEYKNLDTWSLDDLFILLGGVGSLFGLDIG